MFILFTLAFLLGNLCVQQLSTLPSDVVLLEISLVGLIGSLFCYQSSKIFYILIGIIFGFSYTTYYAHRIIYTELPNELEGEQIVVAGTISSIPHLRDGNTQFYFKIDHIQGAEQKLLVRLSCCTPRKRLVVGDRWQFNVKLKRIHGLSNPGSTNEEIGSLTRGIRASGFVVAHSAQHLLSHDWRWSPIDHVRQNIYTRVHELLPRTKTSPWILALIVGERVNIAQSDWQILRATGTNHLMAIAGLHIGMLAGLMMLCFKRIWTSRISLLCWLPSDIASHYSGWLTGVVYSGLAGFSVPAERAAAMLSALALTKILRRHLNVWYIWTNALFFVLLINPLVVLTESFWLSFSTIALIIYGMRGRLSPTGWWWQWGRVQWVIAIGLIPISVLFFHETSLVGVVVNSIAIPWLGVLILPCCLLATVTMCVSSHLSATLFWIADFLLQPLWIFLTYFSNLPFAAFECTIHSLWIFIVSIIAVVIFLQPKGLPGRWLGFVWLSPLCLTVPSVPKIGDYRVTLLDVGQGLSVVVQTHTHQLVFDAGLKWGEQLDMADRVLLPYLASENIKQLDMVIISHGDNDHAGGAMTLLKKLPVKYIYTSVPQQFSAYHAQWCIAGMSWNWDGVEFKFLYPPSTLRGLGNDSSCVLRIANHHHTTLLTGDIEMPAEKYLVNADSSSLASSLLIAPHHGSKTSGLPEFLEAVNPAIVLYSTGYRNRYHFPHRTVVDAYLKRHAMQLSTAEAGAIQCELPNHKEAIKIKPYRALIKNYAAPYPFENELPNLDPKLS